MKNLIVAALLVVGASVSHACGGMTQVDPPALELPSGPIDGPPDSILDSIEDSLVIC